MKQLYRGGYTMHEMNEIDIIKNLRAYAIAPIYNEVYSSKICTYQGNYDSTKTVNQLMDYLCIYFGADLQGRMNAARKILNITKNPPVIISEELEMVGLQLPLVNFRQRLWGLDLDFKINPIDKRTCKIIFKNDDNFHINLSADKVWKKKQLALTLLYQTKYINSRRNKDLDCS